MSIYQMKFFLQCIQRKPELDSKYPLIFLKMPYRLQINNVNMHCCENCRQKLSSNFKKVNLVHCATQYVMCCQWCTVSIWCAVSDVLSVHDVLSVMCCQYVICCQYIMRCHYTECCQYVMCSSSVISLFFTLSYMITRLQDYNCHDYMIIHHIMMCKP